MYLNTFKMKKEKVTVETEETAGPKADINIKGAELVEAGESEESVEELEEDDEDA